VIVTLAPPRPPSPDELEALIREARARQRKRWVGAAALVAVFAGAALGIYSIAIGTHPSFSVTTGRGAQGATAEARCGFRVVGTRVLASDGSVAYRDPSKAAMWHELKCSGSAVWVVFVNGVGMMHEDYVGARSLDRGRTWRVIFAQQPGVRSPHGLDAEVGPWTLDGHRAAYFVGSCPACMGVGTYSLSVTRDAGHVFRRYSIPGSDRWAPRSIRVRGRQVTIRELRDTGLHVHWRTVALRIA
jgi:hypothetical protein